MVNKVIWWLPRPMRRKYRGGFHKGFESRLIKLLGKPQMILQPFSGLAQFGLRVDLLRDVKPDIVADCHYLPFKNNVFDLVLADPPYTDESGKKRYGAPKLKFGLWTKECVRVTKVGGFVVCYHWYLFPRLCGTKWHTVISIITSTFHKARIVSIFQKTEETN